MFHIITKIGGKSCKIIVDGGSCINAVSFTVIENFSLKAIPHPHSYRVTWINSSALEVKQRCLVPIDFGLYKDKIWCDDMTMDVGSRYPWRIMVVRQGCYHLRSVKHLSV